MEIKIESKTLEKVLDVAERFLQKLIGPTVKEVGGLLADNVRAWRFKNQLRLLKNAERYIENKSIQTKKISLKILAPLLEGASLEEDEILQDKWVALLVNYIDSRKNFRSTVFPHILTQLSTEEANGLEYMEKNKEVTGSKIWDKLKFGDAELSNLVRLGLIREVIKIKMQKEWDAFAGLTENVVDVYAQEDPTYCITELGTEFLKACKLEE